MVQTWELRVSYQGQEHPCPSFEEGTPGSPGQPEEFQDPLPSSMEWRDVFLPSRNERGEEP